MRGECVEQNMCRLGKWPVKAGRILRCHEGCQVGVDLVDDQDSRTLLQILGIVMVLCVSDDKAGQPLDGGLSALAEDIQR